MSMDMFSPRIICFLYQQDFFVDLAISNKEDFLKETGTDYPFRASGYTPGVGEVRVVSNVVGLYRYVYKTSLVDSKKE